MSERATFSPFWHRVRLMKPRLRPHVQITRQHYRGQRWHVVHDPSANGFYRLNPVAHEFVGLLDGRRGVEEVWQYGLTRHGDSALTQNEVIQLLSQLFNANLLSADIPPETEQLLGRGRERLGQRVRQQAIGLMYFRIRLFNPDRILTWLEPLFRPLLNPVGFVLWAIWIIAGLVAILPHFSELRTGFENAIAPSNWGWMIVTFICIKLWHESGHGLICKRFGGQVPEFGAMMLVLLPAPYVDASSTWAFSSRWQRMAVGAGGMIFELAAASAAAFIWIATKGTPGLVHQLAYNVMFMASISTVLFNANPLMKFDGYYILSDLLEIPNLMQRATNMLKFLAQKHLYRSRQAQSPTSSPSEAIILIIYGLAALAYRLFLFFSITLYVMGKLFAIGLFLACWTAAMWFILPVGGYVHWLATSSHLAEHRARAILTSLALITVGVIMVGVVPMPDHRRAEAVVESLHRTGVFFQAEGFVIKASHRTGDFVKAGEPIVICDSDRLLAELDFYKAYLAGAAGQEREAIAKDEPAAAQNAAESVAILNAQIDRVQDKINKLTVRAPHDGVIVGNDPAKLVGSFMKEGTPLCEVVDVQNVRIAATITQPESLWLYELNPTQFTAELRRVSEVDSIVPAKFDHTEEAGTHELRHAALGFPGGGKIETEQSDRSGTHTKRPLFTAYFTPEPGTTFEGRPGERVNMRFTLPRRALLSQWVDRLEKLIQGRVKL
jgi:putative peptide zinc metalloprotease protein